MWTGYDQKLQHDVRYLSIIALSSLENQYKKSKNILGPDLASKSAEAILI